MEKSENLVKAGIGRYTWVPFFCCKLILWELSYDNNNNNNNIKFHSTQFNFHFMTSTSEGNVKQSFGTKVVKFATQWLSLPFICISFSCNFIGSIKQALKSGWLFCFSIPFSLAVWWPRAQHVFGVRCVHLALIPLFLFKIFPSAEIQICHTMNTLLPV